MRYCIVLSVAAIFIRLWTSPVVEAVSYGACPGGWHQWKGSCYKSLYPERLPWQDAVRRCNELEGYLATPNSRDENEFLWTNFSQESIPGNRFWIGCTDVDTDGAWECIGDTGEKPYRARWTRSKTVSHCATLSIYVQKWIDRPCANFTRNVMCERPVSVMKDSVTCSIIATDRCLPDHTFKTVTVRGRLQCCLACHKDQRCRSFNLRGKQCELNEDADGVQLLAADKCAHYGL